MATTTDKLHRERHDFDVCVIGGGMAGMCAALASARNGARTCIVQDRPVFGGNASSEVRMWICGAHGKHNKETGLLEEIQLENYYRNPSLNYSIWDSVLWGKIAYQPNLTTFLNTTCTNAVMDGDTIAAVECWTLTSQTWHTISAKQFIDCSGDSVLAAVTGAEFRTGRESRHEFNEDIEPNQADDRTMGNSLLIQVRKTDEPQPYVAPRWAYKFRSKSDLPHRMNGVKAHNFWWIEVGGLYDTIKDAEAIRDELMRVVWGVWDYIKNYADDRAEAENWALEWVGSLPGKRENRRYVGDLILTQNDVRAAGADGYFDDVIAYGGWSMDDHHPAGIYYPGKPTLFHPAPSPYAIPYRTLYSKNIRNLLFAGRNISVTHAALSSTRVMATCALLGQAAGTAAALCVRHDATPRAFASGERLRELQRTLMDDDCWLPGVKRELNPLSRHATRVRSESGDASLLANGMDRDRDGQSHAWVAPLNTGVEYHWDHAVHIGAARFTFDSNLANEKRMPCTYPQKGDRCLVPGSLIKRYKLEAQDEAGNWSVLHREGENYQRLVRVPLNLRAKALRFVPEETWGDDAARLFAFEALDVAPTAAKLARVEDGPAFSAAVARIPAKDLAPPENGLEDATKKFSHSA